MLNFINNIFGGSGSTLLAAEKSIEQALDAISSLHGSPKLEQVRKTLGEGLSMVQFNICGTFMLYDNPEIKVL